MSIACLLVPSLALSCELSIRPDLYGLPVVLTDETGIYISDSTTEATAYGAQEGMRVREALAYYPSLVVLEPHSARVRRAASSLRAALESVSPWVEEVSEDTKCAGVIYASLEGLNGLYPKPEILERAIMDAAPQELHPQLGIADKRFTAYSAARSAAPGEIVRVAHDDAASFLAKKPSGWLPLGEPELKRLRLLGIETLGEFAALPRHAIEAQFGAPGGRAWMAAQGLDLTPLRPCSSAIERIIEHSQPDPPLVNRESVIRTAELLLLRALRQPQALHRFVRIIRLRATTEDEKLWEHTQTMKEPTGDRIRLWTSIHPLLEHANYPGPLTYLELELDGLITESGRQGGLFVEHNRRREHLDEMIRHLKTRYGHTHIARVVEIEPWNRIPERRHFLVDYDP